MDNQKDFAGKGGFIWWVGFVEDRMDPLKLGRLKIRCVGWDADNKMQLPTDALPWAQVAFPVNNVNPYVPAKKVIWFLVSLQMVKRTAKNCVWTISKYST
jgi:hypothetical protein